MIAYFSYGSNMNTDALRAKGVSPLRSEPARLPGWVLRFNVAHPFRLEGGVGNVDFTGKDGDVVHGVLHFLHEMDLAAIDHLEALGEGYDRVTVQVESYRGKRHDAFTYIVMPVWRDESCRPTARYLNIIVKGAREAGIDEDYVGRVADTPQYVRPRYEPFVWPATSLPTFTVETLFQQPLCTAVWGAVFDMSECRVAHHAARSIFGGKDATLFWLQRMDTSTGTETFADVVEDRLSDAQREYLNGYVHDYAREYRLVGKMFYRR